MSHLLVTETTGVAWHLCSRAVPDPLPEDSTAASSPNQCATAQQWWQQHAAGAAEAALPSYAVQHTKGTEWAQRIQNPLPQDED